MVDILFFVIFFFGIVKRAITDYIPPGEITPNRNFLQLASRYANDQFALDFLNLIPFHWMFGDFAREAKYLFFIKTTRIIRGLSLLNVDKI